MLRWYRICHRPLSLGRSLPQTIGASYVGASQTQVGFTLDKRRSGDRWWRNGGQREPGIVGAGTLVGTWMVVPTSSEAGLARRTLIRPEVSAPTAVLFQKQESC